MTKLGLEHDRKFFRTTNMHSLQALRQSLGRACTRLKGQKEKKIPANKEREELLNIQKLSKDFTIVFMKHYIQ